MANPPEVGQQYLPCYWIYSNYLICCWFCTLWPITSWYPTSRQISSTANSCEGKPLRVGHARSALTSSGKGPSTSASVPKYSGGVPLRGSFGAHIMRYKVLSLSSPRRNTCTVTTVLTLSPLPYPNPGSVLSWKPVSAVSWLYTINCDHHIKELAWNLAKYTVKELAMRGTT